MAVDSRWSDIYKHLEKEGFDVYPPGVKVGECLAPYVVVKDEGASLAVGAPATQSLYDVLVYMPKSQYSNMEPFVRRVEDSMDGLWPMIRPTHFRTAAFYDDSVKAWMVSMQYQNYYKNKRP